MLQSLNKFSLLFWKMFSVVLLAKHIYLKANKCFLISFYYTKIVSAIDKCQLLQNQILLIFRKILVEELYFSKIVSVFDKFQTLQNQIVHIFRKLLVEESYFSTG